MTELDETMDLLRDALRDGHRSMNEDDLRDLARQVIRQQETGRPPQVTVFTEVLRDLAEWSERVDDGSITNNEFAELQRLEPRILRARHEGRFEADEYRALMSIYHYIKDGARCVLHLDQSNA